MLRKLVTSDLLTSLSYSFTVKRHDRNKNKVKLMGRAAPAARKYETALWFTLVKSISILIDEKQMHVANVEVMTP